MGQGSRALRWCLVLVAVVAVTGLGPVRRGDAQGAPALSLTAPIGGFQRPTHVTHAGDGSGRLFVAEQAGRIRIVRNGAVLATPFLDIRGRVGAALNGAAFPPGYAATGHFYVQYQDSACASVVARYRIGADPDLADAGSEAVVLRVPNAGYCGHDGGAPVFGPDGYLYVSLGDGTPSGHPTNPAQDPGSLRGKMLRIDVQGAGPSPYAIPPTNPHVSTPGAAPEIWALGLRNPWRFAFSPAGDLYIADVGQGRREEVNVQAADSPGGENYGWRLMEGSLCFAGTSCDASALALPAAEYDHDQGCSVTGGVVYRGPEVGLLGWYIYGDFCSGKLWGLQRLGGTWSTRPLGESTLAIVTFGEAEDGTLFVADYAGGGLYRVAGVPPIPTDLAISQTVVAAADELTFAVRVVNQGASAATGLVVTDALPDGVTVQSMASTAGLCARDGSVVTCRLVSLSSGETATISIAVTPTISGTITNTASVVANEPDPDLDDNVTTHDVAVTSSKDLIIVDLALSAPTVQSGKSVTVSHRVKNVGSVKVTETHTDRIYLSADPTLDPGIDVLLGQSRAHTSDLAPAAGTNSAQAVMIPAATPPGAYYLLVEADALQAVDEREEGNNVTAIPLTVSSPPPVTRDLLIASLALSRGTLAAGDSVAISYTVRNAGTSHVTETYAERFYLSPTGTLDAPGVLLLGASVAHATDLKAGASLTFSATVTVPAGTAPGSYAFLVVADALNAVAEINETNNVGAAALTVSAPPPPGKDLVIENLVLSRSSVNAGGSLTIRYRVANRGTVAVTETHAERYYLSRDALLDPADVLLGSSLAHTVDIPANATYGYSRSVAVPPGTSAGAYHILVQGDALASVPETAEGNNTAAAPLTVTGP
jgi:uncharacterized repeat protein (TIGR01451 family)